MKGGPQLHSLLVAFAAMMLSFMGATAYSQIVAEKIRVLAESLSGNAMPSVEHLSLAAAELRHLQSLVGDYAAADLHTRTTLRDAIRSAKQRIDTEVETYFRLPVYPGEHQIFGKIRRSLSEVDASVAAIYGLVGADELGRDSNSVGNVNQACERAVAALLEDVTFNAKNGAQIGRHIEEVRRRSLLVAIALDALSVVLSALVASHVVRAIRTHFSLLRRHSRLLATRADELELFAGRVAHDIRNPLNAASLSLTLVQQLAEQQPKITQTAQRGLSNLTRASRIVEGLLAFACAGARPAQGAACEADQVVPALLDDLRPKAAAAQIELRCERLTSCTIACDRSILEVLVANLVHNAIKYMGNVSQRKIIVRARDLGAAVRFEIEDTGVGVLPEQQKAIFAPFVRGEAHTQAGIGLGLATVHRICAAHDGRVGVESDGTGGSCFWFELPKPVPRSALSRAPAPEIRQRHA